MATAPALSSVLDTVRPLLRAGASLHWLVPFEKRPIEKEWSQAPLQSENSLRTSYRSNANIGIRLGEPSQISGSYLHLIDLDIKKPEQAADVWSKLLALWPQARSFPRVISGSGGESRHIYFLTAAPFRKKVLAHKKGEWEIALMGTGSQVVLPPSIHPDTRQPYRWEVPLDLDWPELMTIDESIVEAWGASMSIASDDADDDDLFSIVRAEPMDLTDDEVAEILAAIPNDGEGAHYDDYVQTGMALHHQYEGSNQGFEIWCEWAKQSSKFDAKNAAHRWKSFKQDSKNPVRMATLIQVANTNKLADDLDFEADAPAGLPATVASDNDLSDLLGSSTDEPAPAPKKHEPLADWQQLFHRNEEGELKSTLHNMRLIAQNDRRMCGVAMFNEFTQEIVLRDTPIHIRHKRDRAKPMINLDGKLWKVKDRVNGDLWSDSHDHAVRAMIEAPTTQGGYGIKVSDRDLRGAVDMAAQQLPFHPIRERLLATKWDGRRRVETLFLDYLGSPDTAYHRQASMLTLLSAVARIFEPGHKFDFVPILEGIQGKGKSTFIKILGLDWANELTGDISDPKAMVEVMQGSWILEIGELSAMQRSEVNDLKAFVSRTQDKVRLAWAKRAQDYPRQCIFIGSTNDTEYLRDQTGGRRFWPVKCHIEDQIDNARLRTEIDQLWAEAVVMYQELRRRYPVGDLPLYLTDEEAALEALELQEDRRVESAEDVLAGKIEAWLDEPIGTDDRFDDLDPDAPKEYRQETCINQIWEEMLGGRGSIPQTEAIKIGRALQRTGWDRSKNKVKNEVLYRKYGYTRIYTRPEEILL